MRIEYICHACLLIETEDLRIATDPWFDGPAFCGQWHVFPKPVNTEKLNAADTILISHGHEDHLHENTLRSLPKTARVFYPYSFFGGAKEYIEGLGFDNVTEAVTLKQYKISPKTSITFIINSHDSIMVIESGGEVLVNLNDALHSSPAKVIDFYLNLIRERWRKIDYVFCGFGGASYFPNTMHFAGKDDWERGIVREQLFVHNFCRIVDGLKPKIAVPFAADFVLLSDQQRWINEARFPRNKIAGYYATHFGPIGQGPRIEDMYSGDVLENGEVKKRSPYRKQMVDNDLLHLIEVQYAEEIAARCGRRFIDESETEQLVERLQANAEKRKTLFSPKRIKDLKFSLHLTDVAKNQYVNIQVQPEKVIVERSGEPAKDSLLTMKLSSEILRYSISSDWGADVICLGYGAEIELSATKLGEIDKENICMNLLACYPTISDLKKAPLRTLQFLLINPPRFTRYIRKLKKFNLQSENYNRKTWLVNDVGEIRKNYGLPDLAPEFRHGSKMGLQRAG
ncbi:MAG: MBL fold metallo-hydrolase [Chloracidobacterium sp.]|nr:MBL fold metallo-hydrolase [Chloracidobacterium sp.]